MSKDYYVYVLTNDNNNVMYIGITNDLKRRVYEHKSNSIEGFTKKCHVLQLNKRTFKITLSQGLNRQIRRMCSKCGYNVVKLKRTRIINISLNDLPRGKWRYLTDEELKSINKELKKMDK